MSLSQETEALFSSAREALAPTEEERRRNLAALIGKVGAASMGTATAAQAAAHGKGAIGAAGAKAAGIAAKAGGTALALKVAVPLVLSAAVGSSVWWAAGRSNDPGSSAAPVGSVPAAVVVATAPARSEIPAPEAPNVDVAALEPVANPRATKVDSSERGTVQRVAVRAEARSTQPKVAPNADTTSEAPPREPKAAPPGQARLGEELALVERIHGAQRQGKHAEVRALASEYDRLFPDGILREEAHASDVIATCAVVGANEAASRAERFRERYPSSPLLPRIAAACTK